MIANGVPRALRRAAAAAATAVIAGGALTACGGTDDALRTPDGSVISTVTTRIARVNIVNAGRDYSQTCLAPTVPDAGKSDVTRIVVTDPALLDGVCALGIGPSVRAVAAAPGSVPAYLGPQLGAVPAIGEKPTAAQVAEAAPDVVLTTADTAARAAAMTATGKLGKAKVVTIGTGPDWRANFSQVADALNRSGAGADRLREFDDAAVRGGTAEDATHSQVSLVRFFADSEVMEGNAGFAAQIMALMGVQRPAAQRTPEPTPLTDANFGAADADLIYVAADGPAGLEHGKSVLLSDNWRNLGASNWQRVLWVDDDIWYRSSGLAAAWLVLNDLKVSLNSNSASE